MTRKEIFAHADRMSRIYPVNLAQLPRFDQDVDIIYTDGKVDPIWPPDTIEAAGYVVMSRVSPANRLLEGRFAIDLRQCMDNATDERASLSIADGRMRISSNTDFNAFRREVFETVAHEYFHLIQEWIMVTKTGDPQVVERAYVAEQNRIERKLLADDLRWLFKPDDRRIVAYLRNRFERSARHQAEAARHRLGAEVDHGLWDPIFPVAQMQTMAERAVMP